MAENKKGQPVRDKPNQEKESEALVDTIGESSESKAKRSVDEIRKRILDNQPKELKEK